MRCRHDSHSSQPGYGCQRQDTQHALALSRSSLPAKSHTCCTCTHGLPAKSRSWCARSLPAKPRVRPSSSISVPVLYLLLSLSSLVALASPISPVPAVAAVADTSLKDPAVSLEGDSQSSFVPHEVLAKDETLSGRHKHDVDGLDAAGDNTKAAGKRPAALEEGVANIDPEPLRRFYAGLIRSGVTAASGLSATHQVQSQCDTNHGRIQSRVTSGSSSSLSLSNPVTHAIVMAVLEQHEHDLEQFKICRAVSDSSSLFECSSVRPICKDGEKHTGKFAMPSATTTTVSTRRWPWFELLNAVPAKTAPGLSLSSAVFSMMVISPISIDSGRLGTMNISLPIVTHAYGNREKPIVMVGYIELVVSVHRYLATKCSVLSGNQSLALDTCPESMACVEEEERPRKCVCAMGSYQAETPPLPVPGIGTEKDTTHARLVNDRRSASPQDTQTEMRARDLFACMPCHSSCVSCSNGEPCSNPGDTITMLLMSSLNLAALAATILISVMVFLHRRNAVMLSSSWPFLMTSLLGAAMMFASETRWHDQRSRDVWDSCVLSAVLHGMGFSLFYGALFVKMWRISRLLAPDSLATVLVQRSLGNRALLLRLVVICAAMAGYQLLWVLVDRPRLQLVPGQAYQYRCHQGNFRYGLLAGKLLLMVGGLVLCVRTRRASSRFTEAARLSYLLYLCIAVLTVTETLAYVTRHGQSTGREQQIMNTVQIHFSTSFTILLVFLPKLKQTISPSSSSQQSKSALSLTSHHTTPGVKPTSSATAGAARKRLPAALKKRPSLGRISPSAKSTVPHLFRADSVSLVSLHLGAQQQLQAGAAGEQPHGRLRRSQSLSFRPTRRGSVSSTHSLVVRTRSDVNSGGFDLNKVKPEDDRSRQIDFPNSRRKSSVVNASTCSEPDLSDPAQLQNGALPSIDQDAQKCHSSEKNHPALVPRRSSDMSSASFYIQPTLLEDDDETVTDVEPVFVTRMSDLSMACCPQLLDEASLLRRPSDISIQSLVSADSTRKPRTTPHTPITRAGSIGGCSGVFSRKSSNVSDVAVVPEDKVLQTAYPHTFSPQLSELSLSLSGGGTGRVLHRHGHGKVTKTTSLEMFTRQGSDLSARSLRMAAQAMACSSLLAQSPTTTTTPPRSIVKHSPAGSVRGSTKQVSFESSTDTSIGGT
eukprot:scpid29074/ scgid4986/ Probable G-protein coupled receptor CG31760